MAVPSECKRTAANLAPIRLHCSYYSNTRTRGTYTHGGRRRRAGIDMADYSFDAHFLGLAEFLPCDSEKKVCVLAPGQMEHFEALIDVNEDEAAEENANEWAAVLRVANKYM